MDERQNTTTDSIQEARISSCQHSDAVGKRWGDPISEERQAELQSYLNQWESESEAEHVEHLGPLAIQRTGPFSSVMLSAADVYWLIAQLGNIRSGWAVRLHLEGAILDEVHMEGAVLRGVHLEGAILHEAHLEGAVVHASFMQGATLTDAHLEEANLVGTRLDRATLDRVYLDGARLRETYLDDASLTNLSLKGADLSAAHCERMSVFDVDFSDVNLSNAYLNETNLDEAYLKNAILGGAQLKDAKLYSAHLEGADLNLAQMQGVNLMQSHLEGASFAFASLERARLSNARLSNANLSAAHLEGADLSGAFLDSTDLRGVHFDSETVLRDVVFDQTTQWGDIQWGGVGAVDLTQINWTQAPKLGDEASISGKAGSEEYLQAARAYRQLAAQLRAQGISETADRFAYRAQLCRRQVLKRQGIQRVPEYLGSLLLWATAGYGYRLWRIAAVYVGILVFFSLLYMLMGVHSHTGEPGIQTFWDSFLVSLSSIHGRTLFEQLGAWSPAAWVAAIESVFGIVIEGIFVAMLIQRFFAR